MNKWSIKLCLVVLGVILLTTSTVLAACSSGTTTTAPTTATTTAPTTATTTKPAQTIILKLSAHGPPMGANEQIMQKWADMVGEKSGGRVKVECYFGGTLSSAADARASVEKGIVDIAFVPNTEIPSLVPLSLLLEMPLLGFTGARPATYVLNELIKTNPAVAKEYASVKIIAAWMANPRSIHMTKKAVYVPGDLKGTKVLAWGNIAKAMEMMGAAPIQQSPADWYTSLDRGLCEGIVTASNLVNMFKINTLLSYHTMLDMGYAGLALVMNQKSWDSLPADVQKMLDNELDPWELEEQIKVDEGAQIGIAAGWEKDGQTVIHPTPEQIKVWNDAVAPLHQEVLKDYAAKGLPGQEVYDSVKKILAAYSK